VDLALAPNDVVYVVNRSYENRADGVRVTMCTLNEELIREFGSDGEGDGQFVWPTSVALDGNGNVYIADEWLNRISIFDKDGKFLSKWGTTGSGDGQISKPAGLMITNGSILVSDSANNRIQKFSLDGKYQSQFGGPGSGPGQFNLPWGLGLDKDGNIYVADWRNDRIQKFAADGKWLASFGESGSGIGQFNRPSGVCVDKDGDIYVADRQNNRLQVLAPSGRFITSFKGDHQISKWGREKLQSNPDMIRQRALAMAQDNGAFERSFSFPCAVKVDDQYRVCVLDHTRGRIQVYRKTKDPVL
jgi:DNA-binding beta-propeller fold protein YncE